MESQPQNIEFRINPENFHPGFYHQQGFFLHFLNPSLLPMSTQNKFLMRNKKKHAKLFACPIIFLNFFVIS